MLSISAKRLIPDRAGLTVHRELNTFGKRDKQMMNARRNRLLIYFLCIVTVLSIMAPISSFAQ